MTIDWDVDITVDDGVVLRGRVLSTKDLANLSGLLLDDHGPYARAFLKQWVFIRTHGRRLIANHLIGRVRFD